MANQSIFTEKEAQFLASLTAHNVDFIVVGLSAATLHGAPVVTQDIDLWFKDLGDPNIAKVAKECGGTYVGSIGLNPPMFAAGGLGLFDIVLTLSGLNSFEEELEHTDLLEIHGVKIHVLKLERIIHSKKTANRKKDQLVLPVLRDALAVIQSRK